MSRDCNSPNRPIRSDNDRPNRQTDHADGDQNVRATVKQIITPEPLHLADQGYEALRTRRASSSAEPRRTLYFLMLVNIILPSWSASPGHTFALSERLTRQHSTFNAGLLAPFISLDCSVGRGRMRFEPRSLGSGGTGDHRGEAAPVRTLGLWEGQEGWTAEPTLCHWPSVAEDHSG